MNPTQNRRLASLEREIAAAGTLPKEDRRELETLRDLAGQGWLVDVAGENPAESRPARPESRRLVGFDAGESEDIFGGQMLLL